MDEDFLDPSPPQTIRNRLPILLLVVLFLTPILVVEIAHRVSISPEHNPELANPTDAALAEVFSRKGHGILRRRVAMGSALATLTAALAWWGITSLRKSP